MFTPDCNGAADTNYYIELINDVYTCYYKYAGSDHKAGDIYQQVSAKKFWEEAKLPYVGNIVDPRIMFIPGAGRAGQWIAVMLELGHFVHIATTNPNSYVPDPTLGQWKGNSFPLPGNDFTMLGYDGDSIFISTNAEPNDQGKDKDEDGDRIPQVAVIPREFALSYPPNLAAENIRVFNLPRNQYGIGLYPVTDLGETGWPYGTFLGVDNESKDQLTFGLYSKEQRTFVSNGKIKVEPFEPLTFSSQVTQPDPLKPIHFSVDTFASAVCSPDGYNIWCAHTVQPNDYTRMSIRWYRIQLDTATRMPFLADQGELKNPHYDYFNPAIISLGVDDYTLISFSRSGDSSTPQDPKNENCGFIGAYLAILNGATPGADPIIKPLQAGLVIANTTADRWGDFCTISRDPDRKNHPRRFWAVNQYVLDQSDWGTVIASIDV